MTEPWECPIEWQRATVGVEGVRQLVRAEVEAFFAWWLDPKNFGGINDPRTVHDYFARYLRERFGFPEAAPEPKMGETLHTCTMGPDCPNHQTYITPSATADALERALASLGKAYPYLVKHADHIDGEFSNALAEVRRMLGVASARPEAPAENAKVPWPVPNANGGYDYRCQLCGCPACQAKDAFVRALAAEVVEHPDLWGKARLADAARKVVG